MRRSCQVGRAVARMAAPWRWYLESYPAQASVVRAPGGITLGPEWGERAADFTALGVAEGYLVVLQCP